MNVGSLEGGRELSRSIEYLWGVFKTLSNVKWTREWQSELIVSLGEFANCMDIEDMLKSNLFHVMFDEGTESLMSMMQVELLLNLSSC
jgi:hypothetical protein